MNLDVKDIVPIAKKYLTSVAQHAGILLFIGIGLFYGFLLFKINAFNRQEPDETGVNQRIQQVKRPFLDNSQDVKALFQQARENPFVE